MMVRWKGMEESTMSYQLIVRRTRTRSLASAQSAWEEFPVSTLLDAVTGNHVKDKVSKLHG